MTETKIPTGAAALAKAVASRKSSAVGREFERYVKKYGPLRFVDGPQRIYSGEAASCVEGVRMVEIFDPHKGDSGDGWACGYTHIGSFVRVVELKNFSTSELAEKVLSGALAPIPKS